MSNFNCRLCKTLIDSSSLFAMGPFPKAAQYYPEVSEFENDIGIQLEVFKCTSCDLLQLGCDPVPYYKEVITAASFSKDARLARLEELSYFVNLFELKGKKVIEVGSGKGGMIDIMNEAGMVAEGLEYSEDSVSFARNSKVSVIQGYLNDLGSEFDSKYDGFISLNFIEHQPDTKSFIQSLSKITKPGAVGYITAPNVNYLLETNTLYEFVADHLIYFTEETMRRAFEINGFDIVKSSIINNKNDISLIVKKRDFPQISGKKDVLLLSHQLKNFVVDECSKGKKLAVWGAGHRTLALLSIANINEITFIVDSADFKQGKYSPVMHTKIVSPEALAESDIDIIIVMVPGLYPDEVVKTIRSFEKTFVIYKLQDNKLIKSS
jgi:2-polyprenyl-3-methyl-5-hydroxy-6-metoxy-1,4-benzoquinol methylase